MGRALGRTCSIPGCRTNRDAKEPDVECFFFPLGEPQVLATWLKICNRPALHPKLAAWTVCEKHFEPSAIERDPSGIKSRIRLRTGTVPTLNLDLVPAGGPEEESSKIRTDYMTKTVKKLQERAEKALKRELKREAKRRKCKIEEVLVLKSTGMDFEPEIVKPNMDAYCRFCCVKFENNLCHSMMNLGDDGVVSYLLSVCLVQSSTLGKMKNVCQKCFEEFANCVRFFKTCHQSQLNWLQQQPDLPDEDATEQLEVEVIESTDSEAEPPDNESHLCTVCGRMFASLCNLNVHMKFHLKEQDFRCDSCEKVCLTKLELQKHQQKEHQIINFRCKTCGKVLSDRNGLVKHSRLHDTSLQKCCQFCSKRYIENGALKIHMRKHHSDKMHLVDWTVKRVGEKTKGSGAKSKKSSRQESPTAEVELAVAEIVPKEEVSI